MRTQNGQIWFNIPTLPELSNDHNPKWRKISELPEVNFRVEGGIFKVLEIKRLLN